MTAEPSSPRRAASSRAHRASAVPVVIDIGGPARRAHKLFIATQIMFVIGAVFAAVQAGMLIGGDLDGYALDAANNVIRVLMFSSMLTYIVIMALADYRPWFWWAVVVASALMLAMFGFVTVVLLARADDPAVTAVAMVVVFGLPIVWFFRQLKFARELISTRFSALGAGMVEVMAEVPKAWAAQADAGYGRRGGAYLGTALATVALAAIAATAGAFFIVATPLGEDHPVVSAAGNVLVTGFITLPLWGALLALGRRLAMPEARRLLEADARDPVLLLRAFEDDRARLSTTNLFGSILYFGFNRKIRLEVAVADELNRIGPFIAVGQPGETLPSLGAARAYLGDEEWQAQVLQWIRAARLIVIVAGRSHWVGWEMKQVAANDQLNRLVLLLPPKHVDDGLHARLQRWQNVLASFAETPWSARLKMLRGDSVIGVVGTPAGGMLAFTSSRPSQADYELVVRFATYAQFTPAPEAP